jgi:hypothetical protein
MSLEHRTPLKTPLLGYWTKELYATDIITAILINLQTITPVFSWLLLLWTPRTTLPDSNIISVNSCDDQMYRISEQWAIVCGMSKAVNIGGLWRIVSSGMLCRVALVRTDVPEEPSAYFIRVTGIGELGKTQAATSNRHTLRRNTKWERKLEWNSELWIPLGSTILYSILASQKTSFFIVTAVKTSNLTYVD